jgi:glyoxylase-like metal-dependent hydrolase (beta-lactamase superfamily II)
MRLSSPNRRYFLQSAACACCAGAFAGGRRAFATEADTEGAPTILELGAAPMTRIGPTVWVARIAPAVWLHTTTHPVGNAIYPANGLLLLRDGEAVLIDTGWTPEQAELLAEWVWREQKARLRLAVATHFHNDRTGGVEALKALGVRAVAHPLTCRLAQAHGLPTPEPLTGFSDGAFRLNDGCELFFPGPGHTRDNIVAYVPDAQILFGGCFLKSATSADLGNLSDAVVSDWAASVVRMRSRYSRPSIVVPGHGTVTGDAFGHTLTLLTPGKP